MTMETYEERKGEAAEKESADADKLKQKYGCEVYLFGQSQLPDDARRYLRKSPGPLPLRWIPDLLVVRPDLQQQVRQVNLHVDTDEGMKRARERNYVNPKDSLPSVNEWRWLVDSKTGRQDTKYWDLEKSAHEAHRLQRPAFGLPVVYIWPDGCSCSYIEDLTDEILLPGPPPKPWRTPYWLVPKDVTRSLDEVFGKRVSA
jgi:hypothetical protein